MGIYSVFSDIRKLYLFFYIRKWFSDIKKWIFDISDIIYVYDSALTREDSGPLEWRHNGRHAVSNHQPHWPFVRGIHRSPVNSPHKGQWRGALMFSLICAWINAWVNNREAGDLSPLWRHCNGVVSQSYPHCFTQKTWKMCCDWPDLSSQNICNFSESGLAFWKACRHGYLHLEKQVRLWKLVNLVKHLVKHCYFLKKWTYRSSQSQLFKQLNTSLQQYWWNGPMTTSSGPFHERIFHRNSNSNLQFCYNYDLVLGN